MDRIEECGMTEMPAMAPPAPEMDKGNPVTVSVSMNASGKEHVADLLDMMKNAGLGDAAPAADAMMSPRMDMERLSGIMAAPADGLDDREMNLPAIADLDGGEDESYAAEMDDEEDTDESYSPGDENAEGMVSNCCSAPVQDERNGTGRCSACGEGCEAVAEEVETEDMSSEGTYTIKVKGKNMDSQNELARLARLAGLPTNEVDDASMDDNDIDAQAQEFAQRAIEMAKGIQRDNYYFSDSSYYEFFDGQPDDDDDFMNHDLVQQVMRALPNVDMDKDEIKQAVDALAAMDTSDIVDDEVEEAGGDYENEPDEQYSDLSAVIPDGNDLNRKKKSYAATQDGDNPMAVENIKAALYAALTEKKKTMVKGPDGKMVPDYAADGKGKDDLSKGKKDTKTTEGRGKVMAGRGRGKDKLMAGRGRGKKK